MEDAIKKLIDLSEKIGEMNAKLDDVLKAQKSFSEDLETIKECYVAHTERITKAEEKITVLDRQKGGVVACIVSVLLALAALILSHVIK